MQESTRSRDSENLIVQFWTAPEEALFNQKVIAPVLSRSEAWCERSRWDGSGPLFLKLGRSVLYRKLDVLQWINRAATVRSTSEYRNAA